jgi:hypothetical protein
VHDICHLPLARMELMFWALGGQDPVGNRGKCLRRFSSGV